MKHAALYACLLASMACQTNPFGALDEDAGFNPPLTDANVNRFDSSFPRFDGSTGTNDGGGPTPTSFDCGDFSEINLTFDSPIFPSGLVYALSNGAVVENGRLAFNIPAGGIPAGNNDRFPLLDIQGLTLTNGGRVKARLSSIPENAQSQLILKLFFDQTNFAEVNVNHNSAIFRVSIDGLATTVANISVADEWFALYIDRTKAGIETSADGITWTSAAELPAAGLGNTPRVFLQGNHFGAPPQDITTFFDDVNVNCSDR